MCWAVLEEPRPFAEARGENEIRALRRHLIGRQAGLEKLQRFVRLHRVDRLAHGLLSQDAVDPRRHEANEISATLQERLEILFALGRKPTKYKKFNSLNNLLPVVYERTALLL
jgi:hypothetical protein